MKMERDGILCDIPWLIEWEAQLDKEITLTDCYLRNYAGDFYPIFRPSSPRQISWLLYEVCGLDPIRFTSNGFSSDKVALDTLEHPVIDTLKQYRKLTKLKSTYAIGLRKAASTFGGSRIRPRWIGTGTKTGRVASADPNGQNIPTVARRAFTAGTGNKLVACDYGQIELRILAQVSNDPVLRGDFNAGISPHLRTFAAVFGHPAEEKELYPRQYTLSKNINFGVIYGVGADKLVVQAREGGIRVTKSETQEWLSAHRRTYPRTWKWIEETKYLARQQGWMDTLQGHRTHYPDLESTNSDLVAKAEREAVNKVMQGTSGYITKEAMVEWDRCGWYNHWPIRLQVHDEIVIEAPEAQADEALHVLSTVMREVAQKWLPDVPIEVSGKVAGTWDRLK